MSKPIEIPVGQKFGELTVLGRAPNPSNTGGAFVFVRCDCGTETRMRFRSIVRGGVSRCAKSSHWDREVLERGTVLVGQRFGLLTVVKSTKDRGNSGVAQVVVRCDCGVERPATIGSLERGQIRSCGGPSHQAIRPQFKKWKRRKTEVTYAIEAVGTDRIKIGVAANLEDRLLKLQYPCPVELVVIGTADEDIERRLHAELDDHRSHGEWFRKTSEVLDAVRRNMSPCAISLIDRIGIGGRGRVRGRKYRCAKCGELGHFAKTCSATTPPTPPDSQTP